VELGIIINASIINRVSLYKKETCTTENTIKINFESFILRFLRDQVVFRICRKLYACKLFSL